MSNRAHNDDTELGAFGRIDFDVLRFDHRSDWGDGNGNGNGWGEGESGNGYGNGWGYGSGGRTPGGDGSGCGKHDHYGINNGDGWGTMHGSMFSR